VTLKMLAANRSAALGDLALQAVQELGALGAFLIDAENLIGIGLGGGEEL
jgi:hypothetical protein